MAKKPRLLHIWPHWPSAFISVLPLAIALAAVISGHHLSTVTLLCSLLLPPLCYVTCRSLSVSPEKLVLRIAGIPIRRIPMEQVDGFVLIPAHAGHRGRTVPPTAVAVLKPGTIDSYCNERGLKPSGSLSCPNVSIHFNASQEYTIWAVWKPTASASSNSMMSSTVDKQQHPLHPQGVLFIYGSMSIVAICLRL